MSASLYKLAVPRIDGHVLRQRLLTQLQAAIAASAITWLTGLPGAGKSSLAARWAGDARAAGSRVLWYRLDEEDGDVAALFDALKCDLSGSASDLVLPDWSPENRAGVRSFTRRFLSQLLTAGPLLLIFDDCHSLAHDSAFFEMLDAAGRQGAYWSHNAARGQQTTRITIDPQTNGGERGEVSVKGIANGNAMGSGPGGSVIATLLWLYAKGAVALRKH